CYEFNDELWSDSLYLSRDEPTGWRLQDSTRAVEEARRHSAGVTRPCLVQAKDPANWVVSTPLSWPYVLLELDVRSFTLLIAWELPALQAGFLSFALVIGYLSNRAGTAAVLPRELDPRPLVALCQTSRAFERVPLSGPKRPDSLENALSQWGRPDAL